MASAKAKQSFNTSSKWFSFFCHQQEVSHVFFWYALTANKQHHFGCTYQVFVKVLCRTNPKTSPKMALLFTASKAGLAKSVARQITTRSF